MKTTKSTSKWTCTKAQVIFALSSLIAAAMIADYVWASSSLSATYFSFSSKLAAARSHIIVASKSRNTTEETGYNRNQKSLTRQIIPATSFDIPGPELEWEQMESAPVPRLDGYSVQIKNYLYVFAGYGTIDYVHSHIDVYNFTDSNWCDRIDMPKEMAHSHLGIATDGRYVYVVTGQYGPQCRGPISSSFVLDTETKTWKSFPPLPAPRYAPATQIWRGRLHVMGGSKENRHTPGTEHWSIAVKNGKSLENNWRVEIPIPRGGPHRASIVVDDHLYVIGGQEGDFMAKPGSPIFKCSRRNEVVYGDVYMLDSSMKWRVLPSMPKPDSHIECSWVVVKDAIIIVGGTTEKHPVTKRMILVGEVFKFDLTSQKWSVMGRLPYRVKTAQAGFWNDYLYFSSGQRDRGLDNPQPGKVVGEMWRTKLVL
ncbi:kelch repeat-containing protein At3g27220-like [Impatiens glandulifera]|uniref:kelch repeat-containing protein At3g27220-like n=1 Tax=Impatiens glandulifera TaxID=253017 RepID=UPI001FB14C70|nr:kelch repeat-containing protein At3g27220-like [Impatiens glandulifera]